MPVPELDPATGLLPVGRYPCTSAEVRAAFVDSEWAQRSCTRGQIWADFEIATAKLQSVSPDLVLAGWLGGSFTTSKLDPDDIDVTYLLLQETYDALSVRSKKRVTNFGKAGHLRQHAKLRVDAFVLVVRPVANPWVPGDLGAEGSDYFLARGMWDDWWQRHRSTTDKTLPPTEGDAEPRRGYLEVDL